MRAMGEARSGGGSTRRRLLLVATSVLLLIAAVVPASASAAGTGTIEGTVTDAITHAPIAGIEVCAYPLSGEGEEPLCPITHANGTYALTVEAGEYVVEFLSPFGSSLNYVTVYQGGRKTWAQARAHPLLVSAGGADTGVNAAMEEGGQIKGHVAAAEAPGGGIEGVEVCAFSEGEEEEGFGCARTGPGGAYEIYALPTGEYTVFFVPVNESDLNYLLQYYKDSPTVGGAVLVHVTAGAAREGIDALLTRGGEIQGQVTAAPGGKPLAGAEACALVSETEAFACTYTNSEGEYALHALAPGSYAVGLAAVGYQWQYYPSGRTWSLAQQIPVGVGTGVGLWPTELLPFGYVKPPPVMPVVPPPPTSPAGPGPAPTAAAPAPSTGVAGATAHAPSIVISSVRLRSRRGLVSVSLSCAGAACSGTLHITMRIAHRVRRNGHSVTLHRTILLAQGAFSLAAGAHVKISLHETAAGRARLAHTTHAGLLAELLGSVSGGASVTVNVRVSQ
jgi:hypothetical protein